MEKHIERELRRIEVRERNLESKTGAVEKNLNSLMNKVEDKIPADLKDKLELAFYKGFGIVFEKGMGIIDKTYDKKNMKMDFKAYKAIIDKDNEALIHLRKRLDKSLKKDMALTALEGTGLGILGIGLPDIPVFIGVVLRSIYKIASTYGFDYSTDAEKCYILKLITGAMAQGENRERTDKQINRMEYLIDNNIYESDLDREMKRTASIMANELVTYKFVQGMPVVGVVGGYTNVKVLGRIVNYAHLKYEKRCLERL